MVAARKRILIVDDEAPFTRLLKASLEQTDRYEVAAENQPANALAVAERFHPDLVILDVMMPGMDGGQLAIHFQQHPWLNQVPVVFLTGAVRREEVNHHLGRIGGLIFLAKPVDLQEVTSMLTRCLGT